jgi:hypothetical protein
MVFESGGSRTATRSVSTSFLWCPISPTRVPSVSSPLCTPRWCSAGAKIVESELVTLAGVRALRTIIKSRQSPSGMTYVGSVTIPLANCSYVLKLQCEEHGTTGLRESFLLDKKLREGGTVEAAVEEIGRSADAPEHDALFPEHPLARARKHLGFIASALHVDPRLLSVTPFGLP